MILRRTMESLLLGRQWLSQWFAKPGRWSATAALALSFTCGCGESPYQPTESASDFYFAAPASEHSDEAPSDQEAHDLREVASISSIPAGAPDSAYWAFSTGDKTPQLRRLPIVVSDPYASSTHAPPSSELFEPTPTPDWLLPTARQLAESEDFTKEDPIEAVDSTIAVMLLPPMPGQGEHLSRLRNPSTRPQPAKIITPDNRPAPAPQPELPVEPPRQPKTKAPLDALADVWQVDVLAAPHREEFIAQEKTPSESTFVAAQDQQEEPRFLEQPSAPSSSQSQEREEPVAAVPRETRIASPAPPTDDLPSLDISPTPDDLLPPAIATGVLTGAKVNEQAIAKIRRGYQLAGRGAYYAARTEFIGVLRMISQAKDAKYGRPRRTIALAAGLRALEEAGDFAPQGTALDAEVNVAVIATSHRTQLGDLELGDDGVNGALLPQQMMERYLRYGQLKLGGSVAGEPAGSMALHALGKLYSQLGKLEPERHVLAQRKAYAYQQAALMAHNENHLAAHELGVLMAESGHYLEARDLLSQVAARQPHPTVLRNLARVEKELGETTLAAATRNQARALEQQSGETQGVAWVTPDAFVDAAARDAPLATNPQRITQRPAPRAPTPQPQNWRP